MSKDPFKETVRLYEAEASELRDSNAALLASNAALRAALTEMLRQFEPADPGEDDNGFAACDAIVLARAALAEGGVR